MATRRFLITGGSQGIGAAIVQQARTAGHQVVFTGRNDAHIQATAKATGAHGIKADVSSDADNQRVVDEAMKKMGGIDVLVNNAAIFAALKPQPFEEIPEAEWDRVMAVNVKGVWNCARAVAPLMRAQGGGRIVNVASAIVAKGTAFLMHYVTSKGAVVAMTRALARELGPAGITVNAVAPGLILSDTVQANPDITGFQVTAIMQARSLKREAFPDDVEGTVVFLASDDSAFMSGQTLIVDGGSVFSTL